MTTVARRNRARRNGRGRGEGPLVPLHVNLKPRAPTSTLRPPPRYRVAVHCSAEPRPVSALWAFPRRAPLLAAGIYRVSAAETRHSLRRSRPCQRRHHCRGQHPTLARPEHAGGQASRYAENANYSGSVQTGRSCQSTRCGRSFGEELDRKSVLTNTVEDDIIPILTWLAAESRSSCRSHSPIFPSAAWGSPAHTPWLSSRS